MIPLDGGDVIVDVEDAVDSCKKRNEISQKYFKDIQANALAHL